MAEPAQIIQVPLAVALVILISASLLPIGLLALTRAESSNRDRPTQGPDWSIPTLAPGTSPSSLFHRWDARLKLACLLPGCFLIAALNRLPSCLAALALALLAVHCCRLPWKQVGQRLLAMSGFLGMLLLLLPFTAPARPGETLLLFPLLSALPFHLDGLLLALIIMLKACSVALLMEPMFATAPLSTSLQALQQLGLPPAIGQMILLSHRYIFLFVHESKRMYRSMRVRGFAPGTNLATMRTMGHFLGMLFIRSYERTQQVYEAMVSRGYQGVFPSQVRFQLKPADLLLATMVVLAMLGLLLLDRFAPDLWPALSSCLVR
ncbi:cobalt ECF transporter T component CbiQ [Desulfogranum mediterraneum]|uniref:cobalt ECF transporter T component CbiQ n=1 Tax=Desulfogranum mediterraneum TaxID=160661 RepID=UPI000405AC6B|nr:cobalt ECF transporter T component CbiQ [Desulfogranum mediterraneum]